LLAGRSERGASFIPHKERSSELLLQEAHARADGGLRDVQTVGGLNEAPGRNNLHEGSGELDIHVPHLAQIMQASRNNIRLLALTLDGRVLP